MLNVFHVDVGRMMSFDVSVALQSVEYLKSTIERLYGIPALNIVLLVSGGEQLTQTARVSRYPAGMDNPIYMFVTGDFKQQPAHAIASSKEPDVDLLGQVERSMELPANYDSVVIRAQLAARMFELAREEEEVCSRLVHEQHLQQQGWSAVIANMEDLTKEFRIRYRNFCGIFDRHLEKRRKYLELLENFGNDLTQLARIPILPALMSLAEEDFHGFDEFLEAADDVFTTTTATDDQQPSSSEFSSTKDDANDALRVSEEKSSTSPNKKQKMGSDEPTIAVSDCSSGDIAVTTTTTTTTTTTNVSQTSNSSARRPTLNLLQWITSKENYKRLQLMSEECVQALGAFSEDVYEKLKEDAQQILKLAEQGEIKEIKGISERLIRLEEMKFDIKEMVRDQKELSTAFQQNQHRAMNLRDPSILPDLCDSHKSQLVVMHQKHVKIRDRHRVIANAKDELGTNLHTRLTHIIKIENRMSEYDNLLLFYYRCLRRAEKHVNIIEQIHHAPNIYVSAVTEVVRRKIFSRQFRQWASKLSGDFENIHNDEIRLREVFNASFENHFLNILFPGMNDLPPAFATENPLLFDTRLPNITSSDIEMLSSQLPDLAKQFQLPDMGPVIQFFVSRSGPQQIERMEQIVRQQLNAQANATGIVGLEKDNEKLQGHHHAQHQRLSELQKENSGNCDESETDTETEFEKVLTSMRTVSTSTTNAERMARSTATDPVALTFSAGTLTDETESTARNEIDRLRQILSAHAKLSLDCIHAARDNLTSTRGTAIHCVEELQSELQMLHEKWRELNMRAVEREQLLQHNDAAREIMAERLACAENEVIELRRQLNDMDTERIRHKSALEEQVAQLQEQLRAANMERIAAVAEAREQLIHEHKTEIESLRCRFKLMTSMERTTSLDAMSGTIYDDLVIAGGSENVAGGGGVIDLATHETAMATLRTTLEENTQAAVEAERALWQTRSATFNTALGGSGAADTLVARMLEDKERQLDQMREKDIILTKENIQLKTRLDALTNEDANSWLREKMAYLHTDRNRLEEELCSEKQQRQHYENLFRSSTYGTAFVGDLPRSKHSAMAGSSTGTVLPPAVTGSTAQLATIKHRKNAILEGCTFGDVVFVVWNARHAQFMVVQDTPSLYFVHVDSLSALSLQIPSFMMPMQQPNVGGVNPDPQFALDATISGETVLPVPMPFYAVGRITDKQHCQARKDVNRYRVARGSRFYRVKLDPVPMSTRTESKLNRSERVDLHSEGTSSSRSIPQGETHSEPLTTAAATTAIMPATISGSLSRRSLISATAMTGIPHTGSPQSTMVTSSSSTSVVSGAPGMGGFKERTISVTSVPEDDEDASSLMGGGIPMNERCRYVSVCEVDEMEASSVTGDNDGNAAAPGADDDNDDAGDATPTAMIDSANIAPALAVAGARSDSTLTKMLQQSVITEQPTTAASAALNALKRDLMLASADIPQQQQQEKQQFTPPPQKMVDDKNRVDDLKESVAGSPATSASGGVTVSTTSIGALASEIVVPQISIPASIGTSEDSDEYRSLEAKEDDADFPISE